MGLVVKLWMPLNDIKQTSLMVSGFQAKVLLAMSHVVYDNDIDFEVRIP